jgi:PAS domain S-box-containing protein
MAPAKRLGPCALSFQMTVPESALPHPLPAKNVPARFLHLGLIALAYFAAARLGLALVLRPEGLAGFWPASGVALAALLLTETTGWPAILATIFTINTLSNLLSGSTPGTSVWLSMANTFEPALGGWLFLRIVQQWPRQDRSGDRVDFGQLRAVIALAGAASLANALTALLSALVTSLAFNMPFGLAWQSWWIEDGLGILVVTPLILTWAPLFAEPVVAAWLPKKSLSCWLETVAITFLIGVVAWFIFAGGPAVIQLNLPPYLLFPLLLVAALRLSQRGVTFNLALVALIALGSTGAGLITSSLGGATRTENLIFEQLFLCTASLTGLLFSAIMSERRRSEQALRSQAHLLENISEAVITCDTQFIIRSWNHLAEQMYGWRADEVVGRPAYQVLTNLFQSPADQVLSSFLRDGFWQGEVLQSRKDGIPIHTLNSARLVKGEAGSADAVFVTCHDITERKRAEEQVRWTSDVNAALAALYPPLTAPGSTIEEIAAELLAQACILSNSPHGFVSEIDPITRVNLAHTLTPMVTSECRVQGEQRKIAFPMGEDGRYSGLWGVSMNTRQPFFTNTPASHPSVDGAPEGHIPLTRFLSVPVLLGEELVGQIGLSNAPHDYTERDLKAIQRLAEFYALAIQRKRAEQQLKKANQALARAQRLALLGSWESYLPTGELTWSEEMYHIMGFPPGSPMYLDKVLRCFPIEELERFQQGISAAINDRVPYSMNYRYIRPDGQERYIHDEGEVLRDEQGQPVSMIGVTLDITATHLAEEEIRQRNQDLERIRAILSSLAAHFDLQSILDRALQGALELTGMPGGMLCLVDPQQQNLHLAAHHNASADMIRDLDHQPVPFGGCLCGLAASTGEPLILWDNASESQYAVMDSVRAERIQFHAALPLPVKGRCIGILCVFNRGREKPTFHNLELLSDLCGPIALAVENAQLLEKTRREAIQAEALARTAARLSAQLDLQAVAQAVCEEAARVMSAPAAGIFLYNEPEDRLWLAAAYPPQSRQDRPEIIIPGDRYKAYLLAQSDQVVALTAAKFNAIFLGSVLDSAFTASPGPSETVIAASILRDQRHIGLICVYPHAAQPFTQDDLNLLLGLANQAGQAIDNARLFEQVSAGRKHLRALSQQLVEVQEAERRTLALELHDELGQVLNSIKMSLDMIPSLPPDAAQEQVQRAQALASDLVVRVRRMSLELRPSMLDDMGLLPALRWLFKNYQAQTGEPVSFQHTNVDQRFPPPVEITAYRIIQEALTNVIRHAGNKQAQVDAWADEQALNVQIVDHGKGFDPAITLKQHESSGLSGMRERARLLGGELVVESTPGAGTSLAARLPFTNSNPENR